MDPSIINTIITAFVSILTCLIGLHAGRKDSGSPSMKKVSEQQLEQLFLPMERLLSLGCQQDAKGLMSNLFQIIYKIQWIRIFPSFGRLSHRFIIGLEKHWAIHMIKLL